MASQLDGEVVFDDLGRRWVTRGTARRLFVERAELEARQREAQERQDAAFVEKAATNPVWTGIPASLVPDGVLPVSAILQAAKDAGPRRRSVLEHALADRDGAIEFFPIEQP